MLAIIPARGGSKGLPGKNIMNLNGKPLIAYTIEAALKSKFIDNVIISTDDIDIANIGREYGAKVPFLRPIELASDTALAIDNYIYTIDRLISENNISIKDFVVLQPTSPLRLFRDIDEAIELFYNKDADSVISYTEEEHPISWHKLINEDFSFVDVFENKIANRQEYRKTYYPNGAIYVFKLDLIRNKKYYSNKSYGYIMSREKSIDIDSLLDFKFAEFLLKQRNE